MQVSSVSIIRTSALFPSLLQAERMSLSAHPASSHLCNQFVPRIYFALQKKNGSNPRPVALSANSIALQ